MNAQYSSSSNYVDAGNSIGTRVVSLDRVSRRRRPPPFISFNLKIPSLLLRYDARVGKQCKRNVVGGDAAMKLAFCEEGTSLHLVMSSSHEGRLGARFRLLDKGKKEGRSNSPYESTMAVLCANETSEGAACDHKVCEVEEFSFRRL